MARALVSVIVVAVVFAVATPISYSIPFIHVHVMGFSFLREIGDGKCDSAFMSLEKQTNILCQKVKEMEELKEGYNIVATSQGNIIARGVVEFCDGAPPLNGQKICDPFKDFVQPWVYSGCVQFFQQQICSSFAESVKHLVYTDCLQDRLAPSGYLKIPTAIPEYLKGSKFLPKLNNERPNERNSTYKERFSSLNTLVLIMAENDTVLIPKETSWFGYYQDGGFDTVLPPQKTPLYQEDWIGLKKLDDEGRVKFISVAGGHLELTEDDMKKYIVPYLVDDELPPLKLITKRGGASSGGLFSSAWDDVDDDNQPLLSG
ncbi:hypothetical protein J5N97_029721 [Dioscorea zingiberensis]|uniref:Palmitoyl-protein thioesterase 1-like n=1 Tax=Dioscorea zingiberensis TaxID=325984 RepID=A0A9D5H3G6_9LILI|nr:hypothetical protein J5N97_029721 [Dioscorea zingiberensis]